MYSFPYFTETNPQVLLEFMRQHAFAMLIVNDIETPQATQIPFLIQQQNNGTIILRGHIMRDTEHCKALQNNQNVLVIFTGANSYVSASWYTNPTQGSTWNYMTVQAKGKLRFTSTKEMIEILKDLTTYYENNNESKASYNNIPQDYIENMTPHIIGIEISVTDIKNIFKLSQNRDAESYNKIIENLKLGDENSKIIAHEMEKRKP